MPSLIAIALALSLLLPAQTSLAAIYSYKDESGRTVFVDDGHKVPPQHRGSATTIREQRDLPQPEEASEGEKAEPEGEVYSDPIGQLKAREQLEQLERQRVSLTPAMIRGNRVMVPAEVAAGNRTVHLMLLLDTGATHTVLHRTAVKGLAFQSGAPVAASVVGGRKIKAEKVVTQHLDIGPFVIENFPVLLIAPEAEGLPYDGLLGMDFLRDHPYEINFDTEMVHWKRQP